MKRIVLVAFLFCLAATLADADVLSINGGGNNEIVVSPDAFTEGFFTVSEPVTAAGQAAGSSNPTLPKPHNVATRSSYLWISILAGLVVVIFLVLFVSITRRRHRAAKFKY